MVLSLKQIELEKAKARSLFFRFFDPDKFQYLFKVGKYKRKEGWYLYAKDIYGRWRKLVESKSALAIQFLIFEIKDKYKQYRPRILVEDGFNSACFDELHDATWVGNDEMSKEYWKMRRGENETNNSNNTL